MTCLRQGAGHAFAQVISYLHVAFEGRACRADRVLRHGGENGVVRLAFTCSKECHPEKLALWKSCCGSSRARSFSFCELLVADISYSRTAFVEPHWLEARGSMKNMGRKTFLEWKFEVNGNSVWTSQAPSSYVIMRYSGLLSANTFLLLIVRKSRGSWAGPCGPNEAARSSTQ